MINDKPYLIHVHLRNDNRCYWYVEGTQITPLSSRIDYATALDAQGFANVSLQLAIRFGARMEDCKPVIFNTCPMLDELRETRK